jgi:chitin disaccharide deacetylase
MTGGGVLIISADDLGLDERTTDAIRRCFDLGAVTSVSAMVFMANSRSAARLALDRRMPVGLHINLTQRFTGPRVQRSARERQARVVEYFAGPRWRRWGMSPGLFTDIERCIADQLAEFHKLYGCEPSHFDGHEHIHQSLNVLAARTFPHDAKMRPSFTFPPGEKGWVNRAVRTLVNTGLRVRFSAPRYFFCIRDMHPTFGGTALEEKLALSGGSSVEVMTHPGRPDELEVLLSPGWRELIRQRNLGAYESVAAPHRHRGIPPRPVMTPRT